MKKEKKMETDDSNDLNDSTTINNFNNFDELIEIDYLSTLLIRIVDHPNWGKTIEIIQVFKAVDGSITINPSLTIPLNKNCPSIFDDLKTFVSKHLIHSPNQSFKRWLDHKITYSTQQGNSSITQNSQNSQNSEKKQLISLPKKYPPSLQQKNQQKTNVQGQEERKPNLNQKAGSINYLNPERLEERIDGTEFNVNDLIHAIINSQPFAQRVDVPDDQIKLVLFYAFLGKKMITMDVEKEIMRHNIYYNYMKTGRYLREMAEQGLIKMEERIAKKSKNRYYLWKFSDQDDYNRFRSAKPQQVT